MAPSTPGRRRPVRPVHRLGQQPVGGCGRRAHHPHAGVQGWHQDGGSASLSLSLPTVAVGALSHRWLSSFTDRADLIQTVAPMEAGSVAGAIVVEGLLVGLVSADALKLVLGKILLVSAIRVFRGH